MESTKVLDGTMCYLRVILSKLTLPPQMLILRCSLFPFYVASFHLSSSYRVMIKGRGLIECLSL